MSGIEALKNRVLSMFARCVIDRPTVESDGTVSARADFLADEVREDVEVFQQYGFASVPLPGAEGLTVFIGGDRSHGVTVATEDGRYRLVEMKPGEVALYTDEGDRLYFKRGRLFEIVCGSVLIKCEKSARIEVPALEVSGDLSVGGSITAGGDVSDAAGSLADVRAWGKDHIHSGVTVGSGVTGAAQAVPPVDP